MVNFLERNLVATFENITTYFKNKIFFLTYNVLMVIFQIFKKQFLRTDHTLLGSFFPTFTFNHIHLTSTQSKKKLFWYSLWWGKNFNRIHQRLSLINTTNFNHKGVQSFGDLCDKITNYKLVLKHEMDVKLI
jgi:hypothetical protein